MTVRRPAVAGTFYPADPATLAATVDRHLADGRARVAGRHAPKALVAPHAGYVYSGPIAGSAYAALDDGASPRTRVVLLGPAHRVPVAGAAVSTAAAFATPLGEVPVDRDAAAALLRTGFAVESDRAHAAEHSLEVQLPFLQRVLPPFVLVPLAVGSAPYEAIADLLEVLWGGPETLIVISTDLSHYYDYDTAAALDRATADAVLALAPERLDADSACGRIPLGGLLLAAARHRLTPALLDLRSSGDTAGPRDEVVGYGAFALG